MKKIFLCMVFGILTMSISDVSGWTILTIDNAGTVGWWTSIAIDSKNRVHIAYNDYGNKKLKYATNVSGSWATYTIASADVGPYTHTTSIAIDSNDKVHIGYYDSNALKYVTNVSGFWITDVVDGSVQAPCISLAIDSTNKIHISYWDYSANKLRYATNVSGSWTTYIIDTGGYGSIAIDSNDKVYISYRAGGLKYATNASGSWQTYTINSEGGYSSSIAIDSNNGIHIAYYTGILKYATNASGSWVTSTVDDSGFVGDYLDIATDSNGKVHIGYHDISNGDLKYATNVSGSWVTYTIDSDGDTGACTSIAIDSSNQIHISYLDDSNTNLKYATNFTSYAEWTVVDPPSYTSTDWWLYGVHFGTPNEGWAVGRDNGNQTSPLLHYSNGSWTTVTPPYVSSYWWLLGVHFTSSNEGWAAGFDYTTWQGVLLHYLNGTWTLVTPPYVSSSWWLVGVHFCSPDEGWAVGYDVSNNRGVLLHYSYGSWTSVTPPSVSSSSDLTDVHFTSPYEGWAAGRDMANKRGSLLHCTNGTWAAVTPPNVSSDWTMDRKCIHFISSDEGWAVGIDNTNKRGILLHYSNGSWNSVTPPSVSSNWALWAVHFTSSNEGWAMGYDGENKRGVFLHYLNGTWNVVTPPYVSSDWAPSDIHFTSPTEGWAVGVDYSTSRRGILLKYLNEIVSTPDTSNGPTNGTTGTSYSFTTGGSTSNLGHSVQYQFDWGDGTNSGWLPVETTSASHSWSAAATYLVKAQSRCATHTSAISGWSQALSVNISGVTQKPNLTPYQPSGCSDKIVLTKTPCAGNPNMVDETPFYSADTLYVAWWVINNGSVPTTTNAPMAIYLDGQVVHRNIVYPLQPSQTANCCLCVSVGPLSAGTHTIKILVDTTNAVDESNEADNEYTKTITVINTETVSTPSTPSGPTSGTMGTSYSYTTGGSSSNLGHSIQYLFDWGDGTNSGWLSVGQTSASKSWASAGAYSVKTQARCAIDTSVVSSWSETLSVTITISAPETVSTPITPTGPTSGVTGTSYAYTTGGSTSSYGHSVEYQFDWKGDGTDLSSWGAATQSKTWATLGTYNVRARARCVTDSSVVSDWSEILSVTITFGGAATINLPQTGQTKCYASSGIEINCVGTGQDGELQMGVNWPNPRFTVSGDCVTDNLTGLMWSKNGNLANSEVTWQGTLDYVANIVNSGSGLCGYKDWRLPNINEFESLVNAGMSDSAYWLNSQGFINVLSSNCYWSSTASAYSTNEALVIFMGNGVIFGLPKYTGGRIWPVRLGQLNNPDSSYPANIWKTGQTTTYATGDDGDLERGVAWPSPRFTDNGNGTVTDKLTGLMWSKNANLAAGTKTWQEALDYVKTLSTGGYSDWRLPNRKELFSLIDHSKTTPALPADHPFQNLQGYYWSSTGEQESEIYAFAVYMTYGDMSGGNKSADYFYVWPVRGGTVLEYISNPTLPTGPNSGTTGTSYSYTTGGSTSSLGHPLEYQFDWKGDGTDLSPWGSATQSKAWAVAGNYSVRARARCTTDTDVISSWSGTLSVTITAPETVSAPTTPSGPTTGFIGTSCSYTTGGSTSSLGHTVQYYFDWGDATNSGWLPVGTTSASKSWSSAGMYSIKAQARCAIDTSIVSSWSGTLSVTITISVPETVSTPTTPSGPTSGVTGTSYAYTTGGSTSSYGHPVEYQFDWKGDGTDLSSWGSATLSKIWTTAGTYNVRARARCTLDTSVMSGWSGSVQVAIATSKSTRTLPPYYTPSLPLTVAIAINPGAVTQTYSAEDSPPNGWTVSNINENGQWDDVNKKVKWGVFFDNSPRTLTYEVTPPGGETGVKSFSGKASFDGVNEVIGGDSRIELGALFHPADTSLNFELSINEVAAYAAAWRSGQTWPVPPNPIPIEYPTNAGYLWRNGEVYYYDGTKIPPSCWVPGAGTGSLSVDRSPSLKNQTSLKSYVTLSTGTATRDLPNCYTPSVAVSISITVTPGQGTQVYAVEDSPPAGWTVSDINESGGWDNVKKKVKWGVFFDANNRTLTYKATPPVGETGAKTFSGTVSFDGNNVSIGGDQTIFSGITGFLFDYDGDGATDVAAFHLPTDQFFTDYAGNLGQFGWGESDSMPLIWDYDGDGKTDVSIYHIPTNQWFVQGVGNLGQFGWGGEESVPVPGDYNGDGRMERAFYHSPTNRWFVEGQDSVQFGWNGAECIPVPGDYDGDGKTDMVIYHIPSNQWFQYGVGNLGQFGWGGEDCIPVPGDYNGDGKTEIAVYHVPTNQWFVKGMGNLGQYGWGGLESFPIPGDYNGDGVMERGFYRPSENRWFIEGESDFVWGWGGSEFMPITSQIAVYNWFRFNLHKFE